MLPTMTAEYAFRMYANNIAQFNPAAPILALIDEEKMHSTQAPGGIDEFELPVWLALVEPPGPLRQAIFNCEVDMLMQADPEGPTLPGVVIYGWGGEENFRITGAFKRLVTDEPVRRFHVEWFSVQALIGPDLEKDPVAVALRDLVDRSNHHETDLHL